MTEKWCDNGEYHEYLTAANPTMPTIDYQVFPASLHQQGKTMINLLDLSAQLQTPYPATTPNTQIGFVSIVDKDNIITHAKASSQLFYVIRGEGYSESEFGQLQWSQGDLFTVPGGASLHHHASSDAAFYWVHDEPLMRYLAVTPETTNFAPTYYSKADIEQHLQKVANHDNAWRRNRNGVLLANPSCQLTKTVTPTLWVLFNIIQPGQVQFPHRHNSVALDYCIAAQEGAYTLLAKDISAEGELINPQRADWQAGSAFITPPGYWHSHHNDSASPAYIMPVQDAGLVTYQRLLNIEFQKGGPSD